MARRDNLDERFVGAAEHEYEDIPDIKETLKMLFDQLLVLVSSNNDAAFVMDDYRPALGDANVKVLKNLIDSISRLKDGNSRLNEEYGQQQTAYVTLKHKHDAAVKTNTDVEQKLKELDLKLKELQDKYNASEAKAAQYVQELQHASVRDSTHAVQWKEKEARLVEAENKLKDADKHLVASKAALTKQSELCEALTKYKHEVDAKYKELETQTAGLRDSIKQGQDKIKDLEQQLLVVKSDKDKQVQTKEASIRELETLLTNFKSEKDAMVKAYDQQAMTLKAFNAKVLQDKDTKIKEVEQQLESIKTSMTKQLVDRDGRIKTIEQQLNSAKAGDSKQVQDKDNRIRDLETQLASMAANAQNNSDAKIRDLKQQLDGSRKNCTSLQGQLHQTMTNHNRELASLREQLETCQRSGRSSDLDSSRDSLICLKNFRFGDLVFMLRCVGANGTNNYHAINDGCPHYYLSEDTKQALQQKYKQFPSYALGNIVEIEEVTTTPEYNPFGLPMNKTFHVCTLTLLPHTEMVISS